MKFLNLFVDESGQSNPKAPNSGAYILSGCIVDKQSRQNLKVNADQIKFKYWNKTNIVFHSREIGRKEGDFSILKNQAIKSKFEKDLLHFLNVGSFRMFFVIIDLIKAKAKNWNEEKVYQETSRAIVKNFILSLLASENSRGRIIVESATSKKDFYFHKAAGYFLSAGMPEVKVGYGKVQDILTEVSFVTKKNHDIEEQIADLLAYGAKLKFEKAKPADNYKRRLLKIVDSKLFVMHPNTGKKKRRFHSKINSYMVLP